MMIDRSGGVDPSPKRERGVYMRWTAPRRLRSGL